MRVSEINFSQVFSTALKDIQRKPGRALMIALSAIPALEITIRSVKNIYHMTSRRKDAELAYTLGGNLIGICLLTPSALDSFTGARLCGAIGFIFYSLYKGDQKNALLTSRCIYVLCNQVIVPAIMKLITLAVAFFNAVVSIPRRVIALAVLLVGGYLIYAGMSQKVDTPHYRETASKTWAMFSKVWRRV